MSPNHTTMIGRYRLSEEIASGGMASVHFGRLIGPVGFSRTVAIKRLHPHLARNPDFVAGFLDEARLAARIRHPNVVPTVDVIATDDEVLLVMEYVEGETLGRLLGTAGNSATPPSPAIVSAVLGGALRGLHAAHEARSESGEPLAIVHRDVSPQNVLIGVDGQARVLDFGVAKAANRSQETKDGALKGKLGYMSPEQVSGKVIDRRSDLFSAGVVLWEALTATRLYPAIESGSLIFHILYDPVPELPAAVYAAPLQDVLRRALAKDPDARFATALELAAALEHAVPPATSREVCDWLQRTAGDALRRRAGIVAEIETDRGAPAAAHAFASPSASSGPSRRAVGVVAALVIGSLGLIGVVAHAVGAKSTASSASAEEPQPVPTPATSVAAAPAAPVEPTAPAAPAEPTAPAVSTVSALPAPAPPATKPKPATVSHAGRSPAATSRSVPDCQSPTFFDDQGIKHIKPGCLK